jgi:hypothetical protein
MITSWASLIVWLGLSSLLVGTATGPAPENGRLTGSALTQLGQPIPNIFVLIHPNAGGPTTELKVTPEGQFDLRLSPGLYDVLVSSPHFDPVCKLVFIYRGQTSTFTPRLVFNEEGAQAAYPQSD